MNRLMVLFLVGAAFGAAARILRLAGMLVDDSPYLWVFAFGLGVIAALVALTLADHFPDHRRTLHPRH